MIYRVSDLQNFLETGACSTMALASRKLGISQPALSESIKRLEADLECILFYRSRNGIALTPQGKAAFEAGKNAVAQMLEVKSVCSNELLFNGRSISVGCHTVVALYTLPNALKRLGERVPDYKIQIKHGHSREIQSLIQGGQIDVGIVVNPIPVPDIVLKRIAKDEFSVWCLNEKTTPQKLIYNPQLLQTQSILRKWKNHPIDVIETESLELIIRLVEQGIGYGILPERAVRIMGSKINKMTQLPKFQDEICIVHRPEFGKTKIEKELLSALTLTLATNIL